MPRFLLSRRWVLGHLLVVVIVAGCVVAGFWQLDRLHQRRILNARVARQMEMPAEPLSDLARTNESVSADSLAYRRVEVEGTYDPRREVVLVARALGEQNGNHVLTPLVVPGGEAGPGLGALRPHAAAGGTGCASRRTRSGGGRAAPA